MIEATVKEHFCFSYNTPTLDWYTTIKVSINWDDYSYFKIERRYGPSYWVLGFKKSENTKPIQIDLGEISKYDLVKFIKWCEYSPFDTYISSKLIGFSVISTSMNITDMINDIYTTYNKDLI